MSKLDKSRSKRSESLLDRESEFEITEDDAKAFYDNSHNLHDRLIGEVKGRYHYDLYQRNGVDKKADRLTIASRQLVTEDRKLRETIGGPTVRKTKFHPSYWKTWNQERDLLEEISKQEIIKQMTETNPPVKLNQHHEQVSSFTIQEEQEHEIDIESSARNNTVTIPGNDELSLNVSAQVDTSSKLANYGVNILSPGARKKSMMRIPTLPTVAKENARR